MYVDCCLLYEHHVCVAFVVSMCLFNFDMMMNLDDECVHAAVKILVKTKLCLDDECCCMLIEFWCWCWKYHKDALLFVCWCEHACSNVGCCCLMISVHGHARWFDAGCFCSWMMLFENSCCLLALLAILLETLRVYVKTQNFEPLAKLLFYWLGANQNISFGLAKTQ